jgi:hypothetical protein
VKGSHVLGPTGKGPHRVRLDACPIDALGDPEIGDAIERHRLGEALGLPVVAGPLGEADYRTATVAAQVASEVAWIHAAIARRED